MRGIIIGGSWYPDGRLRRVFVDGPDRHVVTPDDDEVETLRVSLRKTHAEWWSKWMAAGGPERPGGRK